MVVTTASSASCGDEPLPGHDTSRIPVDGRLQAYAKAASVFSRKSKKYEQLKQVTWERLRSVASPISDSRILLKQAEGAILVAASAALRDCSDLETKMASAVLHGTVGDFGRNYVGDQTVTPTHSVNREAL